MQLKSNLISLTTLLAAATSTSAATLPKRDTPVPGLVTSFTLSPESNTCAVNPTKVNIPFGEACGVCTQVDPYQKSISVTQLEPRCRVTVYQTADCSDPGIVSGTTGCWSPEGGIYGYRVDCPWYFPGTGEPEACDGGDGGDDGDSCP